MKLQRTFMSIGKNNINLIEGVELSKLCDLKVMAPVPWVPPIKFGKKWNNNILK